MDGYEDRQMDKYIEINRKIVKWIKVVESIKLMDILLLTYDQINIWYDIQVEGQIDRQKERKTQSKKKHFRISQTLFLQINS